MVVARSCVDKTGHAAQGRPSDRGSATNDRANIVVDQGAVNQHFGDLVVVVMRRKRDRAAAKERIGHEQIGVQPLGIDGRPGLSRDVVIICQGDIVHSDRGAVVAVRLYGNGSAKFGLIARQQRVEQIQGAIADIDAAAATGAAQESFDSRRTVAQDAALAQGGLAAIEVERNAAAVGAKVIASNIVLHRDIGHVNIER